MELSSEEIKMIEKKMKDDLKNDEDYLD